MPLVAWQRVVNNDMAQLGFEECRRTSGVYIFPGAVTFVRVSRRRSTWPISAVAKEPTAKQKAPVFIVGWSDGPEASWAVTMGIVFRCWSAKT